MVHDRVGDINAVGISENIENTLVPCPTVSLPTLHGLQRSIYQYNYVGIPANPKNDIGTVQLLRNALGEGVGHGVTLCDRGRGPGRPSVT